MESSSLSLTGDVTIRKKSMPHPEVKLASKVDIELQAMINPRSRKFISAYGRTFNSKACEISFINMKDMSEDACINALNHELEHWAQDLFLTKKEVAEKGRAYVAVSKVGKTPFVEYINPYVGGYDYSQWIKKYGRGCPCVGTH